MTRPPSVGHPADATATALVLGVAAHYRTYGVTFADSVDQAERFLAPFWGRIPDDADADLWAALLAEFS